MTDWTTFKESGNSKAVYLVKLRPYQELSGFALDGGSVYKKSFAQKTVACRFNLTWLTLAVSRVAMSAGDFYYDAATQALYVWLAGGANPATGRTFAYFYMYFSTLERDYDGVNVWREKLKTVPDFNRGRDGFLDRIATSYGNLNFFNAGYWDSIFAAYEFYNAQVEVILTGYLRSPVTARPAFLPWAEAKTIMRGVVLPDSYADAEVSFKFFDNLKLLETPFPLSKYDLATWPNLDPSADGQAVHRGYGALKGIRAVEVDTTAKRFKIDDQAIASIQAVYDDTGVIAHTAYLSAGEFTVTAYQGTVYCDYTKNIGSGPNYSADIKKEIFKNVLGLTDADLDLTSFTALNTARPYALGISVPDPRPIYEIFDEINESILAEDATDRDGRFVTSAIAKPSASDPGTQTYTGYKNVLRDPKITAVWDNVAGNVRLGYARDFSRSGDDQWLYTSAIAGGVKYPEAADLTFQTAIVSKADADSVAALRIPFHDRPEWVCEFVSRIKPFDQSVGQTVKYDRVAEGKGPSGLGAYWKIVGIDENKHENRLTIRCSQ